MASNQVNIIVSAAINQFRAAMNQVQATLQNTAEQMNQVGARMQEVGGAMTKSISAPLAGLGVAAVAAASQFDDSAGRIRARLGATGEEAENLNNIAKNVWKQGFGESVAEAADAVTQIKASMGDISDAELQTATESAFALSKAFGVDVAESTKTASVMMKNFKIDSGEAFDIMTAAMQASGDVSQDMLDTLWEYSPAFSEMGLTGAEAANMVLRGMEAGAFSADKMGDSINEFMSLATDESEKTTAALEALGMDADKTAQQLAGGGEQAKGAYAAVIAGLSQVENDVDRTNLGIALFGSMWEDAGEEAVMAMGGTEDMLGDYQGAAARAADDINDSFGNRMTAAFRELQIAMEPLGRILMDMIEAALPYVERMVQSITGWFNSMDEGRQKMVVLGGVILAALGPVLAIFGVVVKAIGFVVGAFGKVIGVAKTVFKWFGKLKTIFNVIRAVFLFMSGPIGMIVLAIGALIAIGIALYKNWEQVSAYLAAAWQWIKDAATTVFFAIGSAIMTALSAAWNFIKEVFMNIVTTIATQVSAAYNAVKSGFLFIVEAIGSALSSAWNFVKSIFSKMWATIVGIVGNIKDTISKVFNFIKDFILQAVTTYYNNVKSNFELIKNTISSAVSTAKQKAIDGFNALKKGIADAISLAWDTVKGFGEDIIGVFTDIDLGEIGANIMAGLANGISGAWGVVKKAAKKVASNLVDGFTDWLDMHSPSKVADKEIGRMFGLGIAQGLEKSQNPVSKAAHKLADMMQVGAAEAAFDLAPTMSATGFYSRSGTSLSSGSQNTSRAAGTGENGRVYHLDVPLMVDGREIARATARFTDDELKRMETSRQRAAGVIVR